MSKIKHGMAGTRIYRCWKSTHERCYNPNNKDYKNYGGRGIEVRWKDFQDFYKGMIMGYKDDLTLDRVNPNGDYCTENCRWVAREAQARNMRKNIKYKNECAAEAGRRLGVSVSCVRGRVARGWSLKDAFTFKPSKIKYAKRNN